MELLGFVVPADIRGPLLGLVDDADDEERIREAGEAYSPVDRSYDAMMSRFLDATSLTLTILAALQVAALGRETFVPRLQQAYAAADPGSALAENIAVALQRLGASPRSEEEQAKLATEAGEAGEADQEVRHG